MPTGQMRPIACQVRPMSLKAPTLTPCRWRSCLRPRARSPGPVHRGREGAGATPRHHQDGAAGVDAGQGGTRMKKAAKKKTSRRKTGKGSALMGGPSATGAIVVGGPAHCLTSATPWLLSPGEERSYGCSRIAAPTRGDQRSSSRAWIPSSRARRRSPYRADSMDQIVCYVKETVADGVYKSTSTAATRSSTPSSKCGDRCGARRSRRRRRKARERRARGPGNADVVARAW